MTTAPVFYPVAGLSAKEVTDLVSDTILIVPSVSVANVPQLAIDLLICTLDLQLVCRLPEDYVYPFAGPRDLPATGSTKNPKDSGITTALEVFTSKTHGISVIQVRSPTLPGCRNRFILNTLLPFIKASNFSEVIIAGSTNSALSEIIPPPKYKLFYENHTNGDLNEQEQEAVKKYDSLSTRLSNLSIASDKFPTSEAPNNPDKLPESGIVLEALTAIAKAGLKVVAAVIYVFEGDNLLDAKDLADELAALVELDVKAAKDDKQKLQWIEPISWSYVYGKEIPIGLEEGLYS